VSFKEVSTLGEPTVEVFGFEGSVGGFKKRFQRGGEPRWRFLGFEGLATAH
jgi:hypothetical protein